MPASEPRSRPAATKAAVAHERASMELVPTQEAIELITEETQREEQQPRYVEPQSNVARGAAPIDVEVPSANRKTENKIKRSFFKKKSSFHFRCWNTPSAIQLDTDCKQSTTHATHAIHATHPRAGYLYASACFFNSAGNHSAVWFTPDLRIKEAGLFGFRLLPDSNSRRHMQTKRLSLADQQLIAAHEKSLMEMRSIRSRQDNVTVASVPATTPNPHPTPPPSYLSKICINNLVLDTTHTGRVLYGTVISKPFVMSAIFTLVADRENRIVKVAIYNAVPNLATEMAERFIPEGSQIAIREPYFKRFLDGSVGIRIDRPEQALSFQSEDDVGKQRSVEQITEEANALLRAGDFGDAERLFTEALGRGDPERILSVSLCNRSASLLQMAGGTLRDEKERVVTAQLALLCASAAVCLDTTYAKATQRVAAALDKLKSLGSGLEAAAASSALAISMSVSALTADNEPLAGAGATTTAGTLKQRGNDLFVARDFQQASLYFKAAALASRSNSSVLLCNRATCRAQLKRPADALLDSIAAATLNPDSVKAHLQHAATLLEMKLATAATAALDVAMVMVPAKLHTPLVELRQRVDTVRLVTGDVHTGPGDASVRSRLANMHPGVVSEAEAAALEKSESTPLAELASMNAAIAMMQRMNPKAAQSGFALDDRVPPYHLEFSQARSWPSGVDVSACQAFLASSYENARGLKMYNAARRSDPKKGITSSELLQRLGDTSEETLQWFSTAPFGDIRSRFSMATTSAYNPTVLHSYTNTVPDRVIFVKGTVHVSVGFVDLGTLRGAMFTNLTSTQPLRWIGYEASAFCVAKTAVVTSMLMDGAPADHVLQVWFSTGWSHDTLRSFRTALTTVLKDGGADNAFGQRRRHGEVEALLLHWASRDVPLAESRRAWLVRMKRAWTEPANFRRQVDRVALCEYLMTGSLLPADVGSITFSLPSGYSASFAMDECFLHALETSDVVKRLQAAPAELDFVSAAVGLLRDQVAQLGLALRSRLATVELRFESVTAGAVAGEIKRLGPSTMSWSNCSDYFAAAAFHKLAKSCSGPETVHSLHTMNWPRVCFGASLVDWTSRDPSCMGKLERRGYELCAVNCTGLGFDKWFLSPPITNNSNICDWGLRVGAGFCQKYIDAFLAAAGPNQAKLGSHSLVSYSIFLKSTSTIYAIYTYATELNMVLHK